MAVSNDSTSTGRRKWWRPTIIGIGLAIVLGGGALFLQDGAGRAEADESPAPQENADGTTEQQDDEEKAPIPVEVAEVGTGDVSSWISTTANLVAENEVKVLAEAEGRVSRLNVEEGDRVQRGEVLATLVRDDAEIALKKAQLKARDARLAFERARDLYGRELLSREEFDNATMEHDIARQELAEAEWRFEKTTIRAPFAGSVSARMIQVGQHVRPGDELFQITDFDPLVARIYLPEKDVIGLEPSRRVRLTLNADRSVRFAGRIRQISPVVDTGTGTVKVTVEAEGAPVPVRPGSFVSVEIVRETRPDAVLLPREAVVRELKKAHVFVADDGAAVRRDVTLGLEEGDWIEAIAGVAPGDRVVIAGQGGLKEDAPIRVLGDEAEAVAEATADEPVEIAQGD